MLIKNLSWCIGSTLKRQVSLFVSSRHLCAQKWHNIRQTHFPTTYALQHFDSFYPKVYDNKWLSRQLLEQKREAKRNQMAAQRRVAVDEIQSDIEVSDISDSEPGVLSAVSDPENILEMFQTDIESLRDKDGFIVAYYAAKKKGKGRDSKKADDSDKEDNEESDDDDDDDDDLVAVDYVDIDVETGSLRLDIVMKVALPIPRKKIDEIHAEDRIRVNGQRVVKRSVEVGGEDIIDWIQGRDRANPNLLVIRRVKLISVPDYQTAKGRVKYRIRRWPSLVVENYQIHPYESMVIKEEDEKM